MKYKIDAFSPTGQKIGQQRALMSECDRLAADLADQLGSVDGKRMVYGMVAAGGIHGLPFTEAPKGWKRVYQDEQFCYYFPKETKANAEVLAKIRALPVLRKDLFNPIVGYEPQAVGNQWLGGIGLVFGAYFYLLSINEEAQFIPNVDMVEITTTEYKRLKALIEQKAEETELPQTPFTNPSLTDWQPPFRYVDLLRKLESLTPTQLIQEVRFWGESKVGRIDGLDILEEEYVNPDGENAEPASVYRPGDGEAFHPTYHLEEEDIQDNVCYEKDTVLLSVA